MSNVTPLNVKSDRLAVQLADFDAMKDELRQVLKKYRDKAIHQAFINEAFAELADEAAMGPLATILDGDKPA